MKKIIDWIKKNYLILLPVLLLVIFIASMWDKNYPIGGDNILPLNPLNNIEKSIYVWESWNQGMSQWRYTFLLWQIPFYLFSLLGLPVYIVIKIVITSYLVIGFVFTYKFYRTLFKGLKYDRLDLGLFCGFIFVLSASALLILPTTIFVLALPLCSYLVIIYLDTNRFRYAVFFSITISYGYFGHLPQAKYLFIVSGVLFFVLWLYKQLRKISAKKIFFNLIILFIFTFLLNAFILLPFLYEAFKTGGTYGYLTQNVTVYDGNADLHTATLPYITRFFPSSLVEPVSSFGRFLGSPLFTIWTFILWIMAFLSVFLVKKRKEKNIIYILFSGFVLFVFLAKGANPPFGEVYKFLLFNLPLFKIFRTTADTVIGGTIFFTILVTISAYYLTKGRQNFFTIILLIHIFIFSPVYLGYRLITFEQKGQIKKGFSIPNEYYQMGDKLDKINEDLKILSLPLDDAYSYKNWPYMGQSVMAWITKKPFIHDRVAGFPGFTDNLVLQRMTLPESCYWTAINNIGFILREKDTQIPDYSLSVFKFNFSTSNVLENSYFKLEKVNQECFLPHIYAATGVFQFEGEKNSIPDVSRFIKNKQDVVIGLDNPINHNVSPELTSQIIEAYPKEISSLSDNEVTKKVYSDLSNLDPLSFWTYSFNVPIEGNYQMVIDDQGLISYEAKDLKKGNNTVKIPISRSKNLIDNDLINLFISDKNAATFSQTLNDWQGDEIYLLSLKYRADMPGNILLTLNEIERRYVKNPPYTDLNFTLFSQEISHPNPGVYQYQGILRTEINAQKASVTLKKLSGDMIIESFKIEKVKPPKVFFTNLTKETRIIPEISFRKINPTKYLVDIKNATEPYHLVFSESFSPDWKVYIQPGETSDIFQEWRQEPIVESQHIVVNGFANGWNITPNDSKGKTNYTIIIEYWPQRLFYLGVFITFLTLLFGGILKISYLKFGRFLYFFQKFHLRK